MEGLDFSGLTRQELYQKSRQGSDRERAAAEIEIDVRKFNRQSDADAIARADMQKFHDRLLKELIAGGKEAANIQTEAAKQISEQQYRVAEQTAKATRGLVWVTGLLAFVGLVQLFFPVIFGR